MVLRKNAFYYDSKGDIDVEAWLTHVAIRRPKSRLRLIQNATALTQHTSADTKTALGTSCLQQGLVMADLLLDLMLDEDTICAALLYHAVFSTGLDFKIIEEQLNSNVTKLLRGALRMNNIGHFIEVKHIKSTQLEEFRKMLFSMADDMRVVLLKLAERIAWMRTSKRKRIRTRATRAYAQETLAIYASLANRLGIYGIRYELEDLAMEQLAPRLYKRIASFIKERLIDRENYIKEIVLAIEMTLSKIGIQDFMVISRVKNFYGIYRKMCIKKIFFPEVYDLNAIRIIVNTIDECYQVLEVLQTLWEPVKGELDDYIQCPKENNYRSIHLAIYGGNDKVIEIQIRTFEMDEESEHGLAAHWTYKEAGSQKSDYRTKIAWLRQVLIWQKELVKNGMYLMPELTATLNDRVYVLTKTGDIIDLPKGATALDFAYSVDTEIGHYCAGVVVNGISQGLCYILHTGEQVEVVTGRQVKICWDWLNPDLGYLNTAQAKAKVLHWFQQKDYYQHIVTGQLLLEKGCRQLGIRFIDQNKLAQDLSFQSKKEMLAALGSGELRIVQALHTLYPYSHQQRSYVTRSQEILTAQEALPQYTPGENTIEIKIIAAADTDILQEILHLLRKQRVRLVTLSVNYHTKDERTYMLLRVEKKDTNQLGRLLSYLKAIDTVLGIETV